MKYSTKEKHLIAMVQLRHRQKQEAWLDFVELLQQAEIHIKNRGRIFTKVRAWAKCRDQLRDASRALQMVPR